MAAINSACAQHKGEERIKKRSSFLKVDEYYMKKYRGKGDKRTWKLKKKFSEE